MSLNFEVKRRKILSAKGLGSVHCALWIFNSVAFQNLNGIVLKQLIDNTNISRNSAVTIFGSVHTTLKLRSGIPTVMVPCMSAANSMPYSLSLPLVLMKDWVVQISPTFGLFLGRKASCTRNKNIKI